MGIFFSRIRSKNVIVPIASIDSNKKQKNDGPRAVGGCSIVENDLAIINPNDCAGSIDLWAFGMIVVMGGQLYDWNLAYETGFIPFFISNVCTNLSFLIYVCCISEVCGKVPGGSYGLARAVLGFYPGFILGALELLEYISFAAVSVLYVCQYTQKYFNINEYFEPVLWLLFYGVFIFILELKGRYVWVFYRFFAIICIIPPLLYICSTLPHVNFYQYAPLYDEEKNDTIWARGNLATAFFAHLPKTTVGCAGIESITVVTGFVRDPATTIPRSIILTTIMLFSSSIILAFLAASIPPGINTIKEEDFFMNSGFNYTMGLSSDLSEWMIIPAQMGMAFGFFIPYARLTQAMADSNLLPNKLKLKGQKTTKRSMILASCLGYILCIISYYSPIFEATLQNISIIAASICYCAQTYGFYLLRTTYKIDIKKGFKSPFGIYGAYYVWFIFFMLFLSIAGGFQDDNFVALFSTIGYIIIMTIYYILQCQHTQTVSKEEYASIFKFSVMKFNRTKAKNKKSNQSARRMSLNKKTTIMTTTINYVTSIVHVQSIQKNNNTK